MKKKIRKLLTKPIAVVLAAGILFSCFHFLNNQPTISPENPITQQDEYLRFPIAQSMSTMVDLDILEAQPDMEQAEWEHLPDSVEIPPMNVNLGVSLHGDGDGSDISSDGGGDGGEYGQGENGHEEGGDGEGGYGDGDEIITGDGDPSGEHSSPDDVPGNSDFEMPADEIFFFLNLTDVQSPFHIDDPRCYYAITHVFPQLEVLNIDLFINNERTRHYYDASPNRGFINLRQGENWIKAQVTYRFPDGAVAVVTAAANPPMVVLQDPLDIDFSDTNLQQIYEDPDISFFVRPRPEHANIQVLVNGRQIPVDGSGNYNAGLQEGDNWVTFRGSAVGYNDTEVTRRVIYRPTRIRIHSPELEALDFRRTGAEFLERNVTFSVRVEFAETGQPVPGVRMDVFVRGVRQNLNLDGAIHDNVTISLPLGQNQIVIVARGANENNNITEFGRVEYIILTGQGEPPSEEVLRYTTPNSPLPPESVTHNPVLDFWMSPVTIDTRTGITHAITDHKQNVSHTSFVAGEPNTVRVPLRESIMGRYGYRVFLREGRNEINVVLVTDELFRIPFRFVVYFVPLPESAPIETLGSIFVTVDASVLGIPQITGGYVNIYRDQPLSFAVLRLLQQSGFQAQFTGTYNTAMYLRHIIRSGMLASWEESHIPADTRAAIEEAGGASIWHGSYSLNSLGEGDFTARSGWMITQNGQPISGLSLTFPRSGDSVRVSFTLTGGCDIGLG